MTIISGNRRLQVLTILLPLLALAAACVPVEKRVTVSVTPGVIPEELRGARWASFPVHYCVVRDAAGFVSHERFVALVADAFATWGVQAIDNGACDAITQGNGRNEIGWGDIPDQQQVGVHEAGHTRLLFRSCTGACIGGSETRIVEADITIDTEPPTRQRSERCLATTLRHETGHLLGLHHLPSPALMAPAITECGIGLTDADRSAFEQLYGKQGQ